MSYEIQQATTAYALVFLVVDSADHLTGKTGLAPTVTLSKNGAAFGAPAGAVTEIANGWYKVAGNATDANTLGPLALHASAAGADPTDMLFIVVIEDLTKAALRAATAGRALVVDAAGLADANTVKLGPSGSGTAQTARDVGASVLLSPGVGTGQLSLASGAVTVGTNSDKTGYALSAAGIQAIWDFATSLLTTVGSIGKRLADFITGDAFVRLGAPAGASTAADIAAVLSKTPDAAHYTNARGDLLANLDAAISTRSTLGGTAQTGDVYGLLTSAQAEPAAVPAANASPVVKIGYVFAKMRNKRTVTATTELLRNDGDTATIATATVSDDGTTFVKTVDA